MKSCKTALPASLLAALLLFLSAAAPAAANEAVRSFSLSTARTFAPGESVKISLFAHNVPELEFRVYKVRDEQKFFAGLKDLHGFGEQNSVPQEQIDQRTFLERLHDFKADLWWRVRHFFHGQFTGAAADALREQQGKLAKQSRVVGAAQFAQIPLLNPSQLVARWKLVTPPALVSETQILPIDHLAAGVYLIEATDGTYKAYNIAIVTQIAVVERTQSGAAQLYVADRITGAPVAGASVMLGSDGKLQSSGTTDANGFATLAMQVRGGAQGETPDNVWILAKQGTNAALMTPWGYGFGQPNQQLTRAYIYTDRPVYRPGHTVHIKAILRNEQNDTLVLPPQQPVKMTVTGPDDKVVFEKDALVSAHGTVAADLDLESDAALGYYNIGLRAGRQGGGLSGQFGAGSFYVEDYKKPEYQVTVKPVVQRVLQGNPIQATIEARYFFGEPVANAKVTYVVHTSPHYWWDEDEEDDNSDSADAANTDDSGDTWNQTEQQEQSGVLDSNGRLTVTLPTRLDDKHNDIDYRVEARVTDAANREIAGHSTVLATYGSFRVSVQPTSYVVENSQPARVKVTAQDYDGHPVQTAVHVSAAQIQWDSVTHQRTEKPTASADSTTGADGTVLVDLPISSSSGNFQITVSAQTPENRTVQGETWVWIWNGAGTWYQQNTQAQIVADKKSYKVGDVAHLLLVTGLPESWAVVTVEGDSVQSRQLLHATGASFAFDVPITLRAQPNLIVSAVIVHDNQLITAQKSLKVPPVERTLTITVTPSKQQYEPAEKGSFDVFAVDASGKPVEADLSFGVVDEALYQVRPDTTGDIVAAFYPQRYSYLEPQTSFDFYFYGRAGKASPLLAANGLYHPRMAHERSRTADRRGGAIPQPADGAGHQPRAGQAVPRWLRPGRQGRRPLPADAGGLLRPRSHASAGRHRSLLHRRRIRHRLRRLGDAPRGLPRPARARGRPRPVPGCVRHRHRTRPAPEAGPRVRAVHCGPVRIAVSGPPHPHRHQLRRPPPADGGSHRGARPGCRRFPAPRAPGWRTRAGHRLRRHLPRPAVPDPGRP